MDSFEKFIVENEAADTVRLVTVSYTHLDVYKRQLCDAGALRRNVPRERSHLRSLELSLRPGSERSEEHTSELQSQR